MNSPLQTLKVIVLASILTVGIGYVFAQSSSEWTGPTLPAPQGNTPAPLNVGVINQIKNAGLSLNSLLVSGEVKIVDTTQGAGKVLTSDADGKASWQTPTAVGGGLSFAQAYRKDGAATDTGSSAVARPIVVLSGPAEAFVALNNVSAHASSYWQGSKFSKLDGLKCNDTLGWKLSGCWIVSESASSDLFPYYNGCVSNDYDSSGATAEVSISCVK